MKTTITSGYNVFNPFLFYVSFYTFIIVTTFLYLLLFATVHKVGTQVQYYGNKIIKFQCWNIYGYNTLKCNTR